MTPQLESNARTRHSRFRTAGWALALVCALATGAEANTQTLPRSFTTIPAPVGDVAGGDSEQETDDVLLLSSTKFNLPKRKPLYRRYQKMKVLHYQRELEVGREELILKLQSPGKRRSIMTVEVRF